MHANIMYWLKNNQIFIYQNGCVIDKISSEKRSCRFVAYCLHREVADL